MVGKINKKGQIAIFVIVGILIVAAVILLFFLYNRVLVPDPVIDPGEDPEGFIEQCVNEYVETAVEKIIENGGYIRASELSRNFSYPSGYHLQGTYLNVPYLCFTPRNYARCNTIEPLFDKHLEDEIYGFIDERIKDCFDDFENILEEQHYSVDFSPELNSSVEIVPGKVRTFMEKEIHIRKSGRRLEFDIFEAEFESSIYDLAILIQEILRQESIYCNSEYLNLMRANTWADIDKFNTGNDNKIYTIKDLRDGREIRFAVRGCVLNTPR